MLMKIKYILLINSSVLSKQDALTTLMEHTVQKAAIPSVVDKTTLATTLLDTVCPVVMTAITEKGVRRVSI